MSLPADRTALPTVAAGVEGEEGGEGMRAVSQALEDLLLVLPKHAVPVAVEAARSSIEADLSKRRLGLVVLSRASAAALRFRLSSTSSRGVTGRWPTGTGGSRGHAIPSGIAP
jgi:hypothetical protein